MKIIRNINDLKMAIGKIPNLGFVPTMGGLHKGHISLIKESKKKSKKTLVSIYINPTQFNKVKDFKKYPRVLTKDKKILKNLKVDFLFLPKTNQIYKKKRLKRIRLKNNEKILCAKYRKGHFEGVLDIMDRFMLLIKPKRVFMGEKDFQQYFLVKKYLEKKYKTKIYKINTVRDKNFIALSTRNSLLSNKNHKLLTNFIISVFNFKKKIEKKSKINLMLKKFKKELQNLYKIKIEYLEVRNEKDLKIYNKNKKFKLFVAFYINKVRLIDNY